MTDPGFNQLDPFATALNDAIAAGGEILAPEMIDALDRTLSREEASVRAAIAAYQIVPHAARMREIAALRKVYDIMQRVQKHRATVIPILFAEEIEAARREKNYQAKKARERSEKAA